MFHLWVGVMVGALLAYLWGRAQVSHTRPSWQSPRWWLAGVVLVFLLLPIFWDSWRYGSGSLGPIEAVKGVLLPWAAGIGFGIWLFLLVGRLPRNAAAGAPSFIPIAVAMIFVTLIVSEDRYGWLSRLQKVSFGGGGVEFSASPARQGGPDVVPLARGSIQTGRDRVSALIDFMSDLGNAITRDNNYAKELGSTPETLDKMNDSNFANKVVIPLGKRLNFIHQARAYNAIGLITDLGFIDNFRWFVRSGSRGGPWLLADTAALAKSMDSIWEKTCATTNRLYSLGEIESLEIDNKPCEQERAASNVFFESAPTLLLNPALPYGTLLAAMLLNAVDETDAAMKDLDSWTKENVSPVGDFQRFGLFRALYQFAELGSAAGVESVSSRALAVSGARRAAAVGAHLLTSPAWLPKLKRFEKGEAIDPLWIVGGCHSFLTDDFKRFLHTEYSGFQIILRIF